MSDTDQDQTRTTTITALTTAIKIQLYVILNPRVEHVISKPHQESQKQNQWSQINDQAVTN